MAHSFAALGGAESVIRTRAKLLTEAGHEVYMFSTDGCVRTAPEWATSGKVRFIQSSGLEAGHAVLDTIREVYPDVIDVHLTTSLQGFYAWNRICKSAPVVFTLHTNCLVCPGYFRLLRNSDQVCERGFGLHCLVRAYQESCNVPDPRVLLKRWAGTWKSRIIVSQAARVIVNHYYLSTSLLPDEFNKDKVSSVPPCVEVSRTDEVPRHTGTNVLFVGRVEKGKGIDLLLRASSMIKEPHNVIVVGDGPARAEMEEFAQDIGLKDQVRFVGWVAHDDLAPYYRNAAVLAFPTRSDTFGLVGLEAFGHGVPVVAFNVGGISAWLQDGQTGYLVPPFDVSLFATRIGELLGNQDLRIQMGERGRQIVEDAYSAERCYEALVNAYTEGINDFRRRAS